MIRPSSPLTMLLSRHTRRREFITLIGGAAAAWPLAARAQPSDRMRHIGVLMNTGPDDPEGKARNVAFEGALQELGWTDGRNVRIDYRWGAGDADRIRRYAVELVSLSPRRHPDRWQRDRGAVASGNPHRADRVRTGPRSGRRWLRRYPGAARRQCHRLYPVRIRHQREMAGITQRDRAGRDASGGPSGCCHSRRDRPVGRDPGRGAVVRGGVSPVGVHDPREIERAIAAFARGSNGGLIVTVSTLAGVHRDLIVMLAARHKLPAVYYARYIVAGGGLISYGPDFIDQHRRAAGYVDRILKGEQPADLPVQTPTKYELAINLKTAKSARPRRTAVYSSPAPTR